MRFWHKDLLPLLPDKMVKRQWKDCMTAVEKYNSGDFTGRTMKNIRSYSERSFARYIALVLDEMNKRGLKTKSKIITLKTPYTGILLTFDLPNILSDISENRDFRDFIYTIWHDRRYFKQCCYALQERFDANEMTIGEWHRIAYSKVVQDVFAGDFT